jgi:hypothetical protein
LYGGTLNAKTDKISANLSKGIRQNNSPVMED